MKIDSQVTLKEEEVFEAIEKYLAAKGFIVDDSKNETYFIGMDEDEMNEADGTLLVKVHVKGK